VCAEGEHRERDEGLVSVEAERDAGEEPDLGVGRFDQALGEAGVERSVDRWPVCGDLALEVHERGDARTGVPSSSIDRAPLCLHRP
jgi:hypothetical protein